MIDPTSYPLLSPHQIGVLLVEDDALLAVDLAESLKSFGLVVFSVRDARAAILALEGRSDVRVMITDVDFDGNQMSGYDLAHLVAQRWPNIGIVITSGHVRPKVSDLPPGTRFFPKPYQDYQLRGAVYAIIEQQDEAIG